ncbi:MAG: ATP-binding protein [Sedimentisphaerales bacterium]
METNSQKVKIPVFVPLSLAILILLSFSILGSYWLQHRSYVERVQTKIEGTRALFTRSLLEDVRLMGNTLDFLKERTDLQQAWLEKNRPRLLELSSPLFEDIRSKYNITHLYFLNLEKICFLRVHSPTQYDDLINRATLNSAAAQKKPIWGIELGKYGTFTLRVVHPWFIDGKLTGYIELGEEIVHIMPALKEVFGVELFTVIKKQYLARNDWEEGMRMMGRSEANWDFLKDGVVVDSTFRNLSQKSLQNIKKNLDSGDRSLFGITIDNHKYNGGLVTLVDAGGRHVGDIVVIKDVTDMEASLRIFLTVLASVWLIVGSALCILFYMYIRRIELKLTGVYTNLHDQIEKRKQAEGQLRDAYDRMEATVQERTRELSEEVAERTKAEQVLQQFNKEMGLTVDRLTAAGHELEQFAFITSHHLREPVRKISIFGRLLADSLGDKLSGDQRENLEFMIDGANRIEQMIRGLKLYLEASVDKIEFEDIDLNLILQKIKKFDLANELEQTGGTIVVPQLLPLIKGRFVQIRQVMHQLITNSLKYHKNDIPPEIVIRAYPQDNQMVCIEVEDNGIGIKEEYLNYAFNPFKRLHTEQSYEGVGIGLTICKKIVERHGGQIGIRSVYGQGTVVWFILPLAADAEDKATAASGTGAANS